MLTRFKDFERCPICEESKEDNPSSLETPNFTIVQVTDEKSNVRRLCRICKDCRDKCRNDTAFERKVTKKVFKEKVGLSSF